MIKTAIEWYTLDEKLPYDGASGLDNYLEVMCYIDYKTYTCVEKLRWINGKLMDYYDGELVDYTDYVKYWAYVPEIGE